MSKILGTYTHVKNENLEEYFQTLGVPFVGRKMMSFSRPKLTIQKDDDAWTILSVTTFRTLEMKFKLGEEYDEDMPKGALKSTTTLEGEILKTVSFGPNNAKISRTYTPTDDGCVIGLRNEEHGVEAKRYFKRV